MKASPTTAARRPGRFTLLSMATLAALFVFVSTALYTFTVAPEYTAAATLQFRDLPPIGEKDVIDHSWISKSRWTWSWMSPRALS